MNNDLISRETLIEELESLKHIVDCNDNIELCITVVENAPTVERPHGKWIEHYDSSDGFTWLTCSRCMFKAYEEDYNFCPNCGAEMGKETEE